MKKIFFLVFASALFSIVSCSGGGETKKIDSTEVKNMVNEAMDSVKDMMKSMDSSMQNMDSTMKMK